MVKKAIVAFLTFVLIAFFFKSWFVLPFISGHDFPYFFKEMLADFSLFPPAWNPIGMGEETINYSLAIFIYAIVSIFVNTLSFPWELVYKVFIFGLYLFLSVFSSIYLLSKILERPSIFQFLLSSLIFTANTYILMVVDGGQIGVALSYSMSPLVLAQFIKLVDLFSLSSSKLKIKNEKLKITLQNAKLVIIAGLAFAFQVMFDTRIAYITAIIVVFYILFHYFFIKRFDIKLFTFHFSLFTIVVLGLHASWLLPIIILRSHPAMEIVSSFGSVESLRFFSFATFSQTLSLLHPNWPENIFGKTYFLKPEFLILPILAYSSSLFISLKRKAQSAKLQLKAQNFNKNLTIEQFNPVKIASQFNGAGNKTILFFVFLGLLGTFLAKGANPPFGEVNIWLFQNFPGMNMFRDPTKFYLLIALSYLVLVPFSIYSINNWLKSKVTGFVILNLVQDLSERSRNKFGMTISLSFLLFTILYLIFLIRPIFLNQLPGTFAKHEIPKEYILLKNFLHSQFNFSRTLWVPTQQRYNFYSYVHPAMSANALFSATNSAEIVRKLQEVSTRELLSNLSIHYVIIPYDSFGEIFVEDRKYNEKEYLETIKLIDEVNWLKKIEGFGRIKVYVVSDYKDHFWLDSGGSLSYSLVTPSVYNIDVSIDKTSRLVFTESYNPHWIGIVDGKEIRSEKTDYNVNSFLLEKTGRYNLSIYFSKEKYYSYGRMISLIFIALILFALMYSRKKIKV